MDNKDFQTTHTIHIAYDPSEYPHPGIMLDFPGMVIAEDLAKNSTKVLNALIGDDADIMLQILMDPETTRKAIDYVRIVIENNERGSHE